MLAAAVLGAGMVTMTADGAVLKYDFNADNIMSNLDLTALSDRLINKNSQYGELDGDINGDGTVDVFDMIAQRQYFSAYYKKMPAGSWVGEGYAGKRYFWFDGVSGDYTADDGESVKFGCILTNGKLVFNFSYNGWATVTNIKWIDDTHFDIIWQDGKESFTFLSEEKYTQQKDEECPEGMWIGSGYDSIRYFWFSSGGGHFVKAESGMGADFTMDISGKNVELTLGAENENKASAEIEWLDDTHFNLSWAGTGTENFTYAGNTDYAGTEDLTGTYYVSGQRGVRYVTINNYTGTSQKKGETVKTPFYYYADENTIRFVNEDGTSETAEIKRYDKNRFVLTWENGEKEGFARREIVQKDGLTYINGILIVNKTFSLPSTYDPGGLTAEFNAAFAEMKEAAANDGLNLWICSGYRSYSYQSSLYNSYVARDGQEKADTYSARPGHSEHQTGLAADIIQASDSFKGTPEAIWLAENCWKYGFIIRYPEGKQNITGYKYEPWHVRYLGKENAKLIYDSGLTLEEYLAVSSRYQN